MYTINTILEILILLLILGPKKYILNYMGKKGSNLATKQDIKEITQKQEEVKGIFNRRLITLTEEIHLQKYKEQQVYTKKFDAICSSLHFIDTYLSWLNYISNQTPIRDSVTETQLTKLGRKCYNELAITCEDKKLISLFTDIIFKNDEDKNVMVLYNQFRNVARKELGMREDIDFNEDRVFLSRISTKDLANKSKITHLPLTKED